MDAVTSGIKHDDIENVPLRRLSGDSDASDASDKSRLLEVADDFEVFAIDDKLPPADGGYQAWRFLGGVWLIEAMMWGKEPYIRVTVVSSPTAVASFKLTK